MTLPNSVSKGKYSVGVDLSNGTDYTTYTVVRGLRWYDKLLRKLKLSKATWTTKVVDFYTVPPIKKKEK